MSYSPKIVEFTKGLVEECGLDSEKHIQKIKTFHFSHEKLDYAFTILKKSPSFRNILNSKVDKSNAVANDLRNEGKKYLQAEDYTNALIYFTKSISNAENDSEDLSASYGHRAMLLFRKNYFSACLLDIDRALQTSCPNSLKKTLLKLKDKSKLKSGNESQINFHDALPELKPENQLFLPSSNCLKIQKNELVGRYFVAGKDLEVGEVLVVERSFVHTVFPESVNMHCHECLKLCFNLIPCRMCTTALFCSESCRENSIGSSHKYECKMIPLFGQLTQNFVKMVTVALNYLRKENECKDEYDPYSFESIKELTTNEDERDSINFFYPLIMSCIGYYNFRTNTEVFSDFDITKNALKDLIYNCIMSDSINSFNINKYSADDSEKMAQSIFLFSSIFNHSCAPNCHFSYYGRHLVIRALTNIKKGEECNISYNGYIPYWSVGIAERRHYLKDIFFFECHCIACSDNWPTFEFLPTEKKVAEMVTSSNNHIVEDVSQKIPQSCPSQDVVSLQRDLINYYKTMGNRIINF